MHSAAPISAHAAPACWLPQSASSKRPPPPPPPSARPRGEAAHRNSRSLVGARGGRRLRGTAAAREPVQLRPCSQPVGLRPGSPCAANVTLAGAELSPTDRSNLAATSGRSLSIGAEGRPNLCRRSSGAHVTPRTQVSGRASGRGGRAGWRAAAESHELAGACSWPSVGWKFPHFTLGAATVAVAAALHQPPVGGEQCCCRRRRRRRLVLIGGQTGAATRSQPAGRSFIRSFIHSFYSSLVAATRWPLVCGRRCCRRQRRWQRRRRRRRRRQSQQQRRRRGQLLRRPPHKCRSSSAPDATINLARARRSRAAAGANKPPPEPSHPPLFGPLASKRANFGRRPVLGERRALAERRARRPTGRARDKKRDCGAD